jgi:hypothetical protein
MANGVGGAIGFAAGGLLNWVGLAALGLLQTERSRTGPEMSLVLLCAIPWPPIVGASVGLAQWFVPGSIIGRVSLRDWVRTSAVLWLIGVVGAGLALFLGANWIRGDLASAIAFVVAGLVLATPIAIGQWQLLEGRSPATWIWLPTVLVSFGAGTAAGGAAAGALLRGVMASDWTMLLIAAPAFAGAAGGCVSGALSGMAVVYLTREIERSAGAPEDDLP